MKSLSSAFSTIPFPRYQLKLSGLEIILNSTCKLIFKFNNYHGLKSVCPRCYHTPSVRDDTLQSADAHLVFWSLHSAVQKDDPRSAIPLLIG